MNQRKQERLKELLGKIRQIFLDGYENIFELKAFDKLRQQIYEECGIWINGFITTVDLNEETISVNFDLIETVPDEKFDESSPSETRSPLKITKEDHRFAKSLKVKLDEKDAAEIEGVCADKINHDTNAPEADSVTDSTGSTDTRSVDEIIISLKTLALKLNLNSRNVLAKTFNTDEAWNQLGVRFPDYKILGNDSHWLIKIQEVINNIQKRVPGAKNIKKLLTLFEEFMNITLEIQED